ncbi:MAG: methyltransferase, partial [Rhizorhabdus sp.]
MASDKPSPWAAKRRGTLNQFYTRDEVGALLTRELGEINPSMVLDLGAGEGSLATSIARAWPRAHLTTVDIDPTGSAILHERLVKAGATDHEHQIADVFDPALPQRLSNRTFDLAVCNPPFFRPAWRREFADILREADFADACSSLPEATAEIIFLAQNLRLVKTGGTIGLIVPDGLATGWRAVAFRRALLRGHWLRSVIQLPPY